MSDTQKPSVMKSIFVWGIPLLTACILLGLLLYVIYFSTDTNLFDPDTLSNNTETSSEKTQDYQKEDDTLNLPEKNEQHEDINPNKESSDEFSDLEEEYTIKKGDNLWSIAQETLKNSFEWKTILIQNKDKINYTLVSEKTGDWLVIINSGRKLKIRPFNQEKSKQLLQSGKKKYALQLMSLELKNLTRAIEIVKLLINDGYYAYLYRTKNRIKTKTGKKQFFYRIRTGFYLSDKEALEIGAEILEKYKEKNLFPKDYWPVLPSYNELSGELIDFGIQRSRPWVIQLNEKEDLNKAKEEFQKASVFVDFSYIALNDVDPKKIKYRTRLGFFENKAKAKTKLIQIQKEFPEQFPHAQIIEIKNLKEIAPGQSTGKRSKKEILENQEAEAFTDTDNQNIARTSM